MINVSEILCSPVEHSCPTRGSITLYSVRLDAVRKHEAAHGVTVKGKRYSLWIQGAVPSIPWPSLLWLRVIDGDVYAFKMPPFEVPAAPAGFVLVMGGGDVPMKQMGGKLADAMEMDEVKAESWMPCDPSGRVVELAKPGFEVVDLSEPN